MSHSGDLSPSQKGKRMIRDIRVVLPLCAGLLMTGVAAGQEQPKVTKIRDSIYMADTTGNVYLVTTPAGNVIIDTASNGQAPVAKKLLSAQVQGPVKYIILTHGHADHVGGFLFGRSRARSSSRKGITSNWRIM